MTHAQNMSQNITHSLFRDTDLRLESEVESIEDEMRHLSTGALDAVCHLIKGKNVNRWAT